ncbi:uncharacterized protein ACN63O_000311 [Diretmus argenteus]
MLYCWGNNISGQGGPRSVSRPVSWTIPDSTSKICCGEQHTLLLTEDGDVLSSGLNSNGQLGRTVRNSNNAPGRVEGIGGVVTVACGQDHCLAVVAPGHVYSWGAGADGQLGICPTCPSKCATPSKVPIPLPVHVPVVQVACGNSHSLILTKGGDVFSWGLNSHGQLGLGKEVPRQPTPALVQSLIGVAVTQISAGGDHTLFLTLPGLVYCCGANKAGQLGVNRVDEKGRFNICMVPALRPLGVSFISCGAAHSAVLTKDGKVFTFGAGSHGQLGLNSTANKLIPTLVQGMNGPASQIACGSHHTLVLGSSNQLWAFGSGVKGQIGTGDSEGSLTPTLVQLPWTTESAAATPNDMKIAAGWNTNFIYTSPTESLEREQTIGIVDAVKLQNWMAMEQGNAEAEREIYLMFSTSSSLVASFTKASGPPPGAGALTVDVEAASQTFDQLLKRPWIKQSVNLSILINLLFTSRAALKSPEIFVILPTCPLLQDDNNVMNVVLPLAVTITELNEKALGTLRGWWSSLTPSIMTKHILVFKQALSFMLRNGLLQTHNPGVKFLLEVLKLLYKANNKAVKSQKVPLSTFYVDEISGNVEPIADRQNDITESLIKQQRLSTLPPQNIPVFKGDPMEYRLFMRAFEHGVENQGYPEAKRLLKERFGDKYKISIAYLDKALNWPTIKTDDTNALETYALFLTSCSNAMSDLEYLDEMESAANMRTVIAKLPYRLRERFRSVAIGIQERDDRRTKFKDVVTFINKQAKMASHPVFGEIPGQTKRQTDSKTEKPSGNKKVTALATDVKAEKAEKGAADAGNKQAKKQKIRVVFDCGASYKGMTLNEQLLQGPDMTSSLVGVLTRFRQEQVAVMADVESMFHQVKVPPEDVDLLRFLWWPDGDVSQESQEYRMEVHLFGATSSPSCASYALRRCAEDNKDRFDSAVVDAVLHNFYVDDCLRSVASEQEAVKLHQDLKAICHTGGFRLTKWMTNNRNVLSSIPQEDRATEVKDLDLDQDSLIIERALGVQWCILTDQFKFRVNIQQKPLTRRGILSMMSSVYDPLGMLSPVILPARNVLQELSRLRTGWDDAVPDHLALQWSKWMEELHQLTDFGVDRCFKPPEFGDTVEARLHHFSDASETGYGTVTYLVQKNSSDQIHCSFVLGKARVAPLKTTTIPRLELTAATLAVKVDVLLRKELQLPLSDSKFWTDSTAVLKYIANENIRFKTFVANRIAIILQASKVQQWSYINTELNPADCASRGQRVSVFMQNEVWISGPAFLSKPEEEWPDKPDLPEEPLAAADPEVKKHILVNTTKTQPNLPPGFFQRDDNYARKRWRQVQYMSDLFWKRWTKEYLPQLQKRQKWNQPSRNFIPGDIVLIVDDSAPRGSWLMGRIVKTIEDEHGLVRKDEQHTPAIFCRYPFLLTLCCKMAVFNISACVLKRAHHLIHAFSLMWPAIMLADVPDGPPAPVFQLKLRRTHLVEDTFRHLAAADHCAFQRELMVKFVEDMKLTDVNRRDFFHHVFAELMAPESEMFMYNESQTLAWFPARPRVEERFYFLFGVLCGMALYNHQIIHLPFPLALFKKLVNVKPSLDDMKEFEPVVAESCRYILEDYIWDDVENMDLTFTVTWDGTEVELDPEESGKPVTSSNKKEFVSAFVNYAFNKSGERVFEEFRRGFFKVCDIDVVEFFQPEELQGVMVGQENYDWDVFKQNTVYEGVYHAMHPNILHFWEVFEELTADQKKAFLLFLTGCDRVPILGMDEIQMRVAVLHNSTELHFPEAQTCYCLLLLPIYQRYPAKRTLQNRLIEAINHNRGFWKDQY